MQQAVKDHDTFGVSVSLVPEGVDDADAVSVGARATRPCGAASTATRLRGAKSTWVDEAVLGLVLGGKACGLGGGSRGRFRCFGSGAVGLVGTCDAELDNVLPMVVSMLSSSVVGLHDACDADLDIVLPMVVSKL